MDDKLEICAHRLPQIVTHIQSQPGKFQPLVDANIFSDIHPVAPETEPNPNSPRTRICRLCAAEVFFWGLKEWWIRERLKGFVDPTITNRLDCRDGSACVHQKDLGASSSLQRGTISLMFLLFYQAMLASVSTPTEILG